MDESKDKVIKVQGEIVKPSVGQRVVKALFKEDAEDIAGFFWDEFIKPALINLLSDMGHGLVDLATGKNTDRGRSSSYGHRDYTKSYKSYDNRATSNRNRKKVKVRTRADAEEILENIEQIISEEGCATIGDLMEIIGEDTNSSDWRFGWTSTNGATFDKVYNGWELTMPREIRV